MADDGKRDKDLSKRFPAPPPSSELPEAPRIDVKLPPRQGTPQPGRVTPGAYQKLAVAATAATSFIAPIVVLGVGGWWLDQRLHSPIGICAFIGTVVGFIVGIVSLLRVIQQLNR
jgi:hypothetical protein